MICFDSDFIIDFLRGNTQAIEKVKAFESAGREIVTTAINSLEILTGILVLNVPQSKRTIRTKEFLDMLEVLPFDKTASEKAALIFNDLKRKGTQIGLKDTLIAAVAITNNVPLLTRNVKHFEKIKELKIETW